MNVCAFKPFHSGLFVDLPFKSLFEDKLRVIYTRAGIIRAVAFKSYAGQSPEQRKWWLANRRAFEAGAAVHVAGAALKVPREDELQPLPPCVGAASQNGKSSP